MELDEICKQDNVFATNTSSIPITQLAGYTTRPDRFIGMHFFSPASIMKLVEVIPGLILRKIRSRKLWILRGRSVRSLSVSSDRAGFLVNRLLFAFFNEAWRIVNEGVATPEDIDKAVKLGLKPSGGHFSDAGFGGFG